jgi:hypothetical protein
MRKEYKINTGSIISCILCCVVVLAACSKDSNYYNFNFQRKFIDGWFEERNRGRLYYDSTLTVNGNTPICIDNENLIILSVNSDNFTTENKFLRRGFLDYSFGRRIALPDMKDSKEIRVSVHYKSQNLENTYLNVYTKDLNNKLVHKYAEEMPNTDKWRETKIRVPNSQVQYLYISISTETKKLIGESYDRFLKKPVPVEDSWIYIPVQKLWINKIQIKVDELDMADFMPEMIPKPEIKQMIPVPLDLHNENSFSQMKELKNKKIIGIGESAHYTKEFPKIAFSLIKHNILHNNCKLVVLEYPFFYGLKLNLFVREETSFDINSLDDRNKHWISSEEINFLLWLKDYNKTAKRKVSIVGMDFDELESNSDFITFIKE